MKNPPKINPALISAFRVFAAVMLLVSLFPLVLQLTGVPAFFSRFLGNPYVILVEAAVLLIYLAIPWLNEKLGRLYLPIAIVIATIAPVISNFLVVDFSQADELAQTRSLAGQWEVIFLLFVPLILVSWQYGFKVVVFYCLALAVLDLIIILPIPVPGLIDVPRAPAGTVPPFPGSGIFRSWLLLGPTLLRTAVYLLVGFVVSRLVAGQREQTDRLQQAYQQLATYATTNEQLTLSRERNRLARKLHDTLAHTLSAVAVQLEAITSLWDSDREKAHEILALSLKLTRDGLNETRRAIQSLRAAPVEDMGLVMALSNLARSVADRNHFVLDLSLPNEINGWSPDIEHTYYRITEEGLRNVAQHSGAQKIAVSLRENGNHLSLTVHDDGRGFNPEHTNPEQRFGLQGMRARRSILGAHFTINTAPNQGTTIQVEVENHF